jgi:signal transduction histidine kinase
VPDSFADKQFQNRQTCPDQSERCCQRAFGIQHAFSQQLIASQEGERKRIAADLHDSLGQRLVVINNLALFSIKTTDGATTSGA